MTGRVDPSSGGMRGATGRANRGDGSHRSRLLSSRGKVPAAHRIARCPVSQVIPGNTQGPADVCGVMLRRVPLVHRCSSSSHQARTRSARRVFQRLGAPAGPRARRGRVRDGCGRAATGRSVVVEGVQHVVVSVVGERGVDDLTVVRRRGPRRSRRWAFEREQAVEHVDGRVDRRSNRTALGLAVPPAAVEALGEDAIDDRFDVDAEVGTGRDGAPVDARLVAPTCTSGRGRGAAGSAACASSPSTAGSVTPPVVAREARPAGPQPVVVLEGEQLRAQPSCSTRPARARPRRRARR